MFFVFNKPKIYSYLIVLSTVIVLFFTAAVLSEANNLETLTTSSTEEEMNMPINKINTDEKKIAITINCLESNKNIEEILEILNENSVKATFCVYGEWVKKYPEVAKMINEKGNCIANMSNTYTNMSEFSYDEATKSIKEGGNKVTTLIGKKIKLFKCPYGRYSDNLIKAAKDNGYTVIGFNIDTLDYQGLEANVIWDNIRNKISNGSIISMNSNAENITGELKLVLKSLKERNYNIVTVEELLNV